LAWESGLLVRFPVPNFTFIGATCGPCGAKKNYFWPLSNNNTGMAALRADLPVITGLRVDVVANVVIVPCSITV